MPATNMPLTAAVRSLTMMDCEQCGRPKPMAADTCPNCGLRNPIVDAFTTSVETVAKQHGYENAKDMMVTTAVFGGVARGQVRRASVGYAGPS